MEEKKKYVLSVHEYNPILTIFLHVTISGLRLSIIYKNNYCYLINTWSVPSILCTFSSFSLITPL
jgi:hypothetical protein